MGIRAFIFVGLLFASVLIASEVSGGELAETEQIDETHGVETQLDYTWGGGYGGGHGGRYRGGGQGGPYGGGGYGGGYGGRRCGSYGCCGGGYICRCCASAAEAEAYAATQAKAKLQN